MVLDVVPDQFVRIDFRRVRREKEQSEAVFHLVHEAMHRLGLVCGQSVNDEVMNRSSPLAEIADSILR